MSSKKCTIQIIYNAFNNFNSDLIKEYYKNHHKLFDRFDQEIFDNGLINHNPCCRIMMLIKPSLIENVSDDVFNHMLKSDNIMFHILVSNGKYNLFTKVKGPWLDYALSQSFNSGYILIEREPRLLLKISKQTLGKVIATYMENNTNIYDNMMKCFVNQLII